MTIKLQKPDITELKPRITVFGVGGGGGNAVNNMITAGLEGVDFVVANTDAQALTMTKADADHPDGCRTSPKVLAPARSRKSAALPPKSASTRSSTTSTAPTCASSPPAWAAARARVRLRSSRRPPATRAS